MLIQFSSSATGDVLMFSDIAKKLLRLMGQSGNIPGGIAPDKIASALQQLQDAVTEQPAEADSDPDAEKDNEPQVGLATRAWPLIEMLKAAEREQVGIIWEKKG